MASSTQQPKLDRRTRSSLSASDVAIHFTHPELCRGIRVSDLLKCFGQVLRSGPRGNPHTYAFSNRVPVIDAFLSHAWKDPWLRKLLVIVLYFNEGKAAIASNAAVLLAFVGQLRGWLPVYCYEDETESTAGNPFLECPDTKLNRVQGLWCVVCGWTVYFCFLFQGHWLLSLFFKIPDVFLDKVCIQQCVDHVEIDMNCPRCSVKHKGIRDLGAFLCKSRKLLVLYTDEYFSRAWCCYEYACFIAVNSLDNIVLLPLARPGIIFAIAILSMFLQAGHWFEKVSDDLGAKFFAVLTVCCIFPLVWLSRHWGLQRDRIMVHIKAFDLEKAGCSVKSDKELVKSRIARWSRRGRSSSTGVGEEITGRQSSWTSVNYSIPSSVILGKPDDLPDRQEAALGLAEPSATQREAIKAFNEYVRTEGAAAMERCLGSSATPYSSILPIAISFLWRSLDLISANLRIMRYDKIDALVKTIEAFSLSLIFIPLAISLMSRTATRYPSLSVSLGLCFCMVLSIVFTVMFLLWKSLMNLLADFVRGGDSHRARLDYLWIYFVLDLAGLMLLIHSQAHPYARVASVEAQRESPIPDKREGTASRQSEPPGGATPRLPGPPGEHPALREDSCLWGIAPTYTQPSKLSL